MSNLVNRLAALHVDDRDGVADAVVTADLERGRAARTSRRRRRSVAAGVASVGLLALSSAAYVVSSEDHSGAAQAGRAAVSKPAASTPVPPPTAAIGGAPVITPISLVAYTGDQLPGYTVKRIPAGYVLQGISASVLDVAKRGDRSDLSTFVGKIVVMLNDTPGSDVGRPVSVNGHPGRIASSDGVQILTYSDGQHNVEVQVWQNIKITEAQLVDFAEGITVLSSAQVSHG